MKVLAAGSDSNSVGATVVDETGAGGRGVGDEFCLIIVFFYYATLLTPCPCPSYPTPTQQQQTLFVKFLAAGSGSNSAGATVVDKTGAGGRGVGGGFFLIFEFFCYATLLTPRPCPPYLTPTQ